MATPLTASCPEGEVKVRMFGIDTPEMGQKPWGAKSRDALRELLSRNDITLRVRDQDRYGRTVARVLSGKPMWVWRWSGGGKRPFTNSTRLGCLPAGPDRGEAGTGAASGKPGSQQDLAAWRRLNPR